jgi:hypothetical protein
MIQVVKRSYTLSGQAQGLFLLSPRSDVFPRGWVARDLILACAGSEVNILGLPCALTWRVSCPTSSVWDRPIELVPVTLACAPLEEKTPICRVSMLRKAAYVNVAIVYAVLRAGECGGVCCELGWCVDPALHGHHQVRRWGHMQSVPSGRCGRWTDSTMLPSGSLPVDEQVIAKWNVPHTLWPQETHLFQTPGFHTKTLKLPSACTRHDSPWLNSGLFVSKLKPQDGGNRRKGEANLSCDLSIPPLHCHGQKVSGEGGINGYCCPLSASRGIRCLITLSGRIHSFDTRFVVFQGSAAYPL